jgi:hypothetical protein
LKKILLEGKDSATLIWFEVGIVEHLQKCFQTVNTPCIFDLIPQIQSLTLKLPDWEKLKNHKELPQIKTLLRIVKLKNKL